MEFIAPLLCVLFGAALLVLAPLSRHLRHLTYFGSGFLVVAVALLVDILGLVSADNPLSFFNDTLYLISALLIARGTTRRSNRAIPLQVNLGVFAVLAGILAWFCFVQPNVTARVYVLEFSFGLILLTAAWRIGIGGRRNPADRILFWTMFLSGLHFFPRTLLTAYSYSGTGQGYEPSQFWIALSLSISVMVSLGAVALLTSAFIDAMLALKRERDHDPLTGTLNRRAFIEEAERRLMGGSGTGSIVMVDLDWFKLINDQFGHMVGDAVLVELAGLLRSAVSTKEIVGRYGGEEFLILVPDDADAACNLAEAVRVRIAEQAFRALPRDYRITASFGVAMVRDGESIRGAIENAMERADAMLYGSKEEGRNKVCVEHGADIIRFSAHGARMAAEFRPAATLSGGTG